MDKHARELPILERIISEKKEDAKWGMIIGIPTTLLIGGIITYSLAEVADTKLGLFLGLPLMAVIIAALIINYNLVDRQIKKLEDSIGVSSDEEFEDILAGSQKLNKSFLISDRYLINFDTYNAYAFNDVKYFKPYTCSDENSTTYGITIKLNNGKKDYITFSGQTRRDEALKILSTASDFADRKFLD